MLNSFCSKLPRRIAGHQQLHLYRRRRPRDNRLSWFSFSISANQLPAFFYFVSRFLAAHVPFVSASSGLGTEGWCSAMYCSSLSTRSSRSAIGIRVLNYRYAMIVLFLTGLAATAYMYVHVPTGFVPQEDQNYFIVVVQAPQGASLAY